MDQFFEKLQKDGKNSVDNIIKWMKDSKIIDEVKASEEKARKLFEGVPDINNIDINKLKEVINKMAAEQKKNVEELTTMLEKQPPKVLDALQAGASAFKAALEKK
ncbi:uncharacterized protein LOC114246530 [Bombyx mandarina]|uniref:Uncharacterized protein n=2 Tax=Bombyx TaxID=7090 RepID=A0A8R2R256_BOMMO|nr:uncharacterized protein LOC114246530 [Bombyx mandarina]XP_037875122.1 uncharacterized protein LOC105842302 [Bombyx mori]